MSAVDPQLASVHAVLASGRPAAYLFACDQLNGRQVVTSDEIARVVGTHSTMVRRDLSQLVGRSGKRGVGYNPAALGQLLRARDVAKAGRGSVLLIAACLDDPAAFQGGTALERLIGHAAELADEIDLLLQDPQPSCRVCGCTDSVACDDGCEWVEPDLCSSCVTAAVPA